MRGVEFIPRKIIIGESVYAVLIVHFRRKVMSRRRYLEQRLFVVSQTRVKDATSEINCFIVIPRLH